MKPHLDYDIAIIGGGVIGLSIAISLQQSGKTVIIIDQDDEQINASRKNAGAFAFADITLVDLFDIIKILRSSLLPAALMLLVTAPLNRLELPMNERTHRSSLPSKNVPSMEK